MEKQSIKNKREMKQLETLKGYLIFMALSATITTWLFFRNSWLVILIALFFLVRLYRSQQLLLIVSCFFVSVIFGAYFYWQSPSSQESPLAEKSQLTLLVDPNSLISDGDSLKFEGRNQKTGESYALHYQLQSELEKEVFANQRAFFELVGEVELEEPVGQRNLDGFNYQQFLLEKGIYRVGKLVTIRAQGDYSIKTMIQLLKVWRRHLSVYIDQTFSAVTASYMKSLFLGIKDSTFKSQQEVWSQLGILHFFSISGMHIFFFISHFRYMLLRLGITVETVFWLELVFLFVYLFLAGFSTSVGRSVVFIGLSSLNRRFNWQFSELDSWSATLVLSLVINPYVLFQAAGQLSFGLSFYIIYLRPLVANVKPPFRQLVFSLVMSMLAIPIMSANFYEWHLLGMVLTFILLPVFSRLLLPLLSFLLGISFLHQAERLSEFIESTLKVFQQVLGRISSIDFLKVVTGSLPPILYLTCLIISFKWLSQPYQKKVTRWGLLLFIICLPSSAKFMETKGIVAFVDVGQGDSILIQRPFRQETILIDTGGRLPFEVAEAWQKKVNISSQASYTLVPFLKSRGVKTLDQVFISHGDEDHFGDLIEINRVFEIKELLYPAGTARQSNFQKALGQLEKQTKQSVTAVGDVWQNQDYRLEVLSPQEIGDGGNNDSMVLLLGLKGKKIMFTGDLEALGETDLVAHFPGLSADILKVAHHGSRSSSTEAFLKQLKGKAGVISCGINNRFGHPHDETLSRLRDAGMKVYQTDQQGMIYYQWSIWDSELSDVQTIRKSY